LPSTAESKESLDERAREVLREIIRIHAETGGPVSSRSLAKLKKFHSSAATLRNLMADLTDAGYLSQPHTSAGRVPTERGYRHYVRSLMKPKDLSANTKELVALDLSGAGHDPSLLFPAVSKLLSRLSGEVGIVVAPDSRHTVVRELKFVPIGRDKALAIQVGEGDLVFTRLIDTGGRLDAAALDTAGRKLTAEFGGSTLVAMRNRVTLAMQEERARFDRVLFDTLDLARRVLAASEESEVYTEGARLLLDRPEFSQPESIKRVYKAFEERANLVELLDRCLEGEGPRIVIGSESHLTSGKPISAVVTRYGGEHRPQGVLGIIGSLRMSYPKIVPLVEFLGRTLSEKLEEGAEGGESKDGRSSGSS
jgi:heat-inducible transcriptional repressor